MTIGIVEYGMGNIFSLYALFDKFDIDYRLSSEISILEESDILLLPGVGSFNEAMLKLTELNLVGYLKKTEKPIIGICLGMQLLFENGNEGGKSISGLSLIKGSVDLIRQRKLPNVGFSRIIRSNLSIDLLNQDFYFTHSYAAERIDPYAQYAVIESDTKLITAAVQKEKYLGFQFHPELSQNNGVKLLEQIKAWHIKE